MGKKNKKRSRYNNNNNGGDRHHPNKKQKQKQKKHYKKKDSYWVNCRESKPREGQQCLMTIVITQSDLVDDFIPILTSSQDERDKSKQDGTIVVDDDKQKKTSTVVVDRVVPSTSLDDAAAVHKDTAAAAHKPEPVDDDDDSTIRDASREKRRGKSKEDDEDIIDKQATANGKEKATACLQSTRSDDEDAMPKDTKPHAHDEASSDAITVASICHSRTNAAADEGGIDDYGRAFIAVKRLSSANKQQSFPENSKDFRHLPNGDCGDGIVNPFPTDEVADKYWAQRRRLFSKYDNGIQLDKEGWFSVTPEAIANHVAKRVAEQASSCTRDTGMIVLDAFCGCGGNAIAFANRPEISLVVCVDTDWNRLQMAANNASLYNIAKDKLLFVHDNAIHILSLYLNGKLTVSGDAATMESSTAVDATEESNNNNNSLVGGYLCNGTLPERLDCVFLSPPWGGGEYEKAGKGHFSIKNHICIMDDNDLTKQQQHNKTLVNGEDLLKMAAKAVSRQRQCVVYFLPRNLNGIAMGRSALRAGYTGEMEVEKNVLNGKLKTITCYLGFDGARDREMATEEGHTDTTYG